MAGMTKSVSGSTTTYVITDMVGSTVTASVVTDDITGNLVTFSSSGGLHYDGLAMLDTLVQLLATGLLPEASIPLY